MNTNKFDFNAGIVGLGVYLPNEEDEIVTEKDFIKAGVSKEQLDEWGVYGHRVSKLAPSGMSIEAVKNLIEDNPNIKPEEIDLIIDCALVPDYIHPSNSHKIQYELGKLGINNAATFDILPAGGSGIIPALMTARSLILTEEYKNVLITCSNKFSAVADKTEQLSRVVPGDAAAAVLISKVETGKGILASNIITSGEFHTCSGIKMKRPLNLEHKDFIYEETDKKMLFITYGSNLTSQNREDERKRLEKFIFSAIPSSAEQALEKAGIRYEDVKLWITHQNIKYFSDKWMEIINEKANSEKANGEKIKCNFLYTNNKYGNLYTATLLVNLKEAIEQSKVKDDEIVVLVGLNSGFAAGAVVIRL